MLQGGTFAVYRCLHKVSEKMAFLVAVFHSTYINVDMITNTQILFAKLKARDIKYNLTAFTNKAFYEGISVTIGKPIWTKYASHAVGWHPVWHSTFPIRLTTGVEC